MQPQADPASSRSNTSTQPEVAKRPHAMLMVLGFFSFVLCIAALPPLAKAADPVPIFDYSFAKDAKPPVADAAWAQAQDIREFAASFWIRLDKPRKSPKPTLGLFDCRINAENLLELRIKTIPTELMAGEQVIRSRDKVKYGEWHHVALSYSLNARMYTLYLDGTWQMEILVGCVPTLALGAFTLADDFVGKVRDLKLYDAALSGDELTLSTLSAPDLVALQAQAEGLAKGTANADLRSWAEALATCAGAFKADLPKRSPTRGQVARLKRGISHVAAIAKGFADGVPAVSNAPLTCYAVRPFSQEPIQPYDLPKQGWLSDNLKIMAALGEVESTSFVVIPFRPIKEFTIRVGDLNGKGGRIPASAVDAKLVKRWFRCSGAWLSYFSSDERLRVLVPDLLVNDDKLIRVNEYRETQEMRHSRPGGIEIYEDISRFSNSYPSLDSSDFRDAATLQPVDLWEAGRNQQYLLTLKAPTNAIPGVYHGSVELLADGKTVGKLRMDLRVLPFALPAPKTNYDINRTYYCFYSVSCDVLDPKQVRNAAEIGGIRHMRGIASSPEAIAIAREAGFPMDELLADGAPYEIWIGDFGFEGPKSEFTPAVKEQVAKRFKMAIEKQRDYLCRYIGSSNVVTYQTASSEWGDFGTCLEFRMGDEFLRQFSGGNTRFLTHSMGNRMTTFLNEAPGWLLISSGLDADQERLIHAAGGRIMNYCKPFPSSENPAFFRRGVGLSLYKKNFDGQMMHGLNSGRLNEFTYDPGGDGAFRNFGMVYCGINKLAFHGTREGYHDVAYATLLKQQALAHRDDPDGLIAREARRQLAWMGRVDGEHTDLDAFRAGAAYRIVVLMNMIKAKDAKRASL